MKTPRRSGLIMLFVGLLFSVSSPGAETLTVSLSQEDAVESATAVRNSVLGVVHPPLQIDSWDAGGGSQTRAISVGSGAHGSFNPDTYLRFHDGTYGGDGVVRINTDVYPELEFTDFTLESGWTLRPTGSRPLVIRSLSSVIISGSIDCSGENGESLNEVISHAPLGGLGRCGGADGGAGGATSTSAVSGSSPTTNAGAGGSGGVNPGGGGGGGAGMDTTAPSPGPGLETDDSTPAGAAGAAGGDISFSLVGGGGGGGGGALYDDALDPATLHASGGGGGAGGGTIFIHAIGDVTLAATGSISARGGNGGGSVSARKGGGGGAGGGGSIQIFSGGQITIDGAINALGGAGGVSSGGDGGDGGAGRTWVSDSNTNPTGSGAVDPMWIIPDPGVVNYQMGSFEILSTLIDTRATRPEIRSLTIDATVPNPSTVSFEVAASEQPFDSSAAQWFPAASAPSLSGKRYLRFRVLIDNQNQTQPPLVRSISLEYEAADHGRFDFASCQLVGSHTGAPPAWLSLLVMMAPLLLWMRLRGLNAPRYQKEPGTYHSRAKFRPICRSRSLVSSFWK